jgi:hypothetical protein
MRGSGAALLLQKVEGGRLDALDVLCAEFKGECMLGNRKYCCPLTITDYCSRHLLACESCVDQIHFRLQRL